MQDLNDLLYFAEVVDRGGFAAAGRSLGVPMLASACRKKPMICSSLNLLFFMSVTLLG